MAQRYWLFKSEPTVFSFDDLLAAPRKTTAWEGVRNYQARNRLRDDVKQGDGVLFYHSSCPVPGVAGLATVAREAYPDPSQFDPTSDYHDPKADPAEPRWLLVDVRAERKLPELVSLEQIKATLALAKMDLLRRGNRLSIQPVSATEWKAVLKLGGL